MTDGVDSRLLDPEWEPTITLVLARISRYIAEYIAYSARSLIEPVLLASLASRALLTFSFKCLVRVIVCY